MKLRYLFLLLPSLALSCEKLDREENIDADDLSPAVPIELTKADQGVRDASNAFGLKTFCGLYEAGKGQEVVFSPLSLSLALAMAAEGAAGDTYKQFSDVIGWGGLSRQEVGAFYRKMVEGLVTADPSVQFTSANSYWVANGFPLKKDYQSLLEKDYAAEGYQVDFTAAATLEKINRWCSDKTDGKIPKMLAVLDPDTVLMLINALLFKAPWSFTWDIRKNRDFRAENGKTQKKDFLFVQDHKMQYGDFGDFELVRIPYGNGAYEMAVVLPKEGKTLAAVVPTLEPDQLSYPLQEAEVTLYLPKWSTDYSTGTLLIPVLKAQGLTLPFNPYDADFSGISTKPTFINMIMQKVRIDVTEKGTEFAAVTAIGFATTSIPITPPKVTVDFNRPFAYIIRERSSGTILLLGTLSE